MKYDLFDIVMKLNGPVYPLGETNADNDRFDNMQNLIDLSEKILFEINSVVSDADRQEYSMKRIGMLAKDHMRNIKDA